MPITPRFDVQQSASHVLLRIRVPHIRVSGAELHASGRDLTFHCRPFFLKLTLPHEVLDPSEEEQDQEKEQGEQKGEQKGERSGAVYDPDDEGGVITVRVRKRQPGLHFPGLDLQTRLLQLRKDKDRKEHAFPSIEVLGEQRTPRENGDEENDDEEEEGESEGSSSCAPSLLAKNQNYYGFNSKYTQILTNLREETAEMTSLPDPENMTLASRQQLRQQSEEAAFCPDRYLGDLLGGEEDYIYQQAVGYTAQWEKQWALWKAAKEGSLPPAPGTSDEAVAEADGIMRVEVFDNSGGFSEEEKDTMRSLPNKEYLIAKQSAEERLLMLGLADILFAYCYDHRVTQGESTVESPYTVATLSPTLSFFEVYSTVNDPLSQSSTPSTTSTGLLTTAVQNLALNEEPITSFAASPQPLLYVLKQCGRRCCIYPYLRVFSLIKKIYTDVTKILLLGQRAVLRCLLQTKKIFEATDTHYLLNKLYLDDYCVWLQSLGARGDELCTALGREYNAAKRDVTKESLGLNLVELEKRLEEGVDDEVEESNKEEEINSGPVESINARHPGITVLESSDEDESSEEESSEDEDSDDEDSDDDDNDASESSKAEIDMNMLD